MVLVWYKYSISTCGISVVLVAPVNAVSVVQGALHQVHTELPQLCELEQVYYSKHHQHRALLQLYLT